MQKKLLSNKPKILLMLGYPRSGSTVFGELISQSTHFLHVGEMERLWYPRKNKASFYPQKECSCGSQLYECDFWLPYFDKVAEKIKEIKSKRGVELNSKILCGYKEDFIQKGKIHGPEAEIYTEVISTLYSELYKGEGQIIVDGSKELWYAKYLESTGLFDLSYLHLIRDVKGIVYSRQKKLKKKDEESNTVTLNYKYLVYDTLRWNYINTKTRKFLEDKRSVEVTYEDMVKKPKDVLKTIGDLMEVEIASNSILNSQNAYFIEDNHLVHGNRFRFKRGEVKLKKDTRYLEEMKEFDLNLIDLLSWFKLHKN
ncbi:sulfotransferase domain-containing protein [Gramella lutea]|uniref:Sulfotransferase domain-containing protein n=1 Tax=Christiangramia lutea TaxID=1607951 RepID=A0A9X1V3Z6_9FLAO|nr:sulfotransferase [Christiangramia lutea]MCH4823800.1 sulfotransferase domain-containing protein [Christiangramia lutea]